MPIKAIKGILTYKSKYLLQLRDNKKRISFPNHWGLFGGRKEKKESDTFTLEREIKEETNLDIKIQKEVLNVNFKVFGLKKKRILIYFDCSIKNNNNIVLKEGRKYGFFSFNQLKKLKIVPMDFVAIKSHYLKNNGFISIYK
jgi:8-oxo-dGTP diphosphatase